LQLPADATAQLASYIALLERWNRVYNLTAVRAPEAMVARHILDSLSILPWLRGPRVLDMGSGAGLPGIPLALARPDLLFTLLDSNGKRTRFMQQVVTSLGLTNVRVIQCRVEQYRDTPFDCITSRALAPLSDMLKWCERLCQPDGQLLAMKGAKPETELATLATGWSATVHPLQVPDLDARHHLVVLTRLPTVPTLEETVDSHLQADD